jgi:hypothetical protein
VSVHIKGKRRGLMSEIFLHSLDVIAGLQAVYGVSMTEIMKSCRVKVQAAHDLLECKVHSLVAEVSPGLSGKHKVIRIVPAILQPSRPTLLPKLLLFQGIHHTIRRFNNTRPVIFQTAEAIFACSFFLAVLLVNEQGLLLKVHTIPC